MRHFGIFSNNMSQWLKIMQIPFMSQKKLEIVHKILQGKSCVKKPYHLSPVFFIRIWGVVRKEGETQKKASLNFFLAAYTITKEIGWTTQDCTSIFSKSV